jgi:hypothetical protein
MLGAAKERSLLTRTTLMRASRDGIMVPYMKRQSVRQRRAGLNDEKVLSLNFTRFLLALLATFAKPGRGNTSTVDPTEILCEHGGSVRRIPRYLRGREPKSLTSGADRP